MMKFLVTGCAGFIGTSFTRYLLDRYPAARLVGVDLLTYAANTDELEKTKENERFSFYRADIADHAAMDEIFAREHPSVVVNFAAESHVDRSIEAPHLFVQTNVLGTQALLEASRRHGVTRFHQVSTDEVYGDVAVDDARTFDEDAPLSPSSPYSASKAAADMLVLAYRRTYGLSVTVSRSTNNYGPYQHREKLIPLAVTNAAADLPVPIYGDGKNVRDWLHVQDHCRAIDLILHRGRDGGIYNIAGGNMLSNIDLVKRILRLLGKPQRCVCFVPDRKGHDRKYAVNADKITRELGFIPSVPFDEGLAQTLEFYK